MDMGTNLLLLQLFFFFVNIIIAIVKYPYE